MPVYSANLTGGGSPNTHRLDLHVQLVSQNVANNTSTIAVSLRLVHTGGTPGSWSTNANTWSVYFGNTWFSGTTGFDFRNNVFGQIIIYSGTRTFTHNANGTLSLWFEGNFQAVGPGTTIGGATGGIAGGTYALPTIARASVSSISGSSPFDLGTSLTINTNRASNGFTHTIQLWEHGVGATSPVEVLGTGVGSSMPWTPDPELAQLFPDATTKQFFLRTITFSGSTQIGVRDSVFTLRAPSSMVPTISGVTAVEQNPVVTSAGIGAFVQGFSSAKLTVNASGVQGSSIEVASILAEGQPLASGGVVNLNAAGSRPISANVIDSRGRTASWSGSLNVLAYDQPRIDSYQVRRATNNGTPNDDGTYLRIDVNAYVQSLISGGSQKNNMTVRVFTREAGGEWVPRNVSTPTLTWSGGVGRYNPASGFLVSGGGAYATNKSFQVRIDITDKLNTTTTAVSLVSTTEVLMHWGSTGVGVGKMHEQGALDVTGTIYQSGNVVVDSALTSTTGRRGIVELATNAETLTGTDTARAVTPAGLKYAVTNTLNHSYQYRQTLYYTSSGTFKKADYPWLRAVRVRVQGGGGGGGGSAAASGGMNAYGAGGGGGGYAEKFIYVAELANSEPIQVGGGADGGLPNGAGYTGGESYFGAHAAATGGGGGGFKPNSALGGYITGGSGGEGIAGDLKIFGSGGGDGSGANTLSSGGEGGGSVLGGGGRAVGTGAGGGSNPGWDGGNYGGGGGGAQTNAGGPGRYGGAGAPGIVIVELYS